LKILWVKAGKLIPVNTGGRIRSYNLLRHLTTRHQVTLLSYYIGQQDAAYDAELCRQLPGAIALAIPRSGDSIGAQVLDYLPQLASRAPYAVTKFTAPEVQGILHRCMEEGQFDVAVCDFLAASLNFPQELPIPTVLFQHNCESLLWRRQAQFESNWLKRIAFKLEAAKMSSYEPTALRRFHHIIAVSEEDRREMMRFTEGSRISVVPTGVDLRLYQGHEEGNAEPPVVVFTGSMDWEANIDGVEYFCREVWPLVQAKQPHARFRIVGRDPHPRVRKLACDSVEVTGTVPSVVKHLREAIALVVPLRIGGGTRLKIYEAMAMGKAVVSTSVGAEGLDVHDGRDILLGDDAETFANGLIRLLGDGQLRQALGTAAARTAAQYDWPTIADRFADVLERVTARHAAARETLAVGAPISS
jgi:glycosyltransferase involved in cell wall biosynthesis